MKRICGILIAMLAAAVTAAAELRLPSGAKHFSVRDNVVAYFQQVSSAAGTGTSTHMQSTAVRRYTGADGRHAYTFPARALLPSLPRWSTPDPTGENYTVIIDFYNQSIIIQARFFAGQ